MEKHYYIYKIETSDGKIYYGKRESILPPEKDVRYLGSGVNIAKYSDSEKIKTIIAVAEDSYQLSHLESIYIKKGLLLSNCLNIAKGTNKEYNPLPPCEKRFYTATESAEFLLTSERAVQRRCQRNNIPKVDGEYRIVGDILSEWLDKKANAKGLKKFIQPSNSKKRRLEDLERMNFQTELIECQKNQIYFMESHLKKIYNILTKYEISPQS
jgi:hypothetical protein